MTYLQIGVPKCGNFWLYQILQLIREKSGQSTRSFIEQQPVYELAQHWDLNFPDQARIDVLEIMDLQCRYRISSIFKMPIDDMAAYVSGSNHVWTHSPYCPRSPRVMELFHKKIYIVRDPRDRAISAARYFTSPYMLRYFPQPETDPQKYLTKNFERMMREWVWHVYDYVRLAEKLQIHIVFFEGLKHNFQQELDRLLQYLEVELSPAERRQIEEAVSFNELKKENPQHLRKGGTGYWKEQLTPRQAEWATAFAGPLLHYLGYGGDEADRIQLNRQFPHRDFTLLKQQLIDAHQYEFLPYS